MGKDIRNTKKQEEFFAIIGDLSNPSAQMMGELKRLRGLSFL